MISIHVPSWGTTIPIYLRFPSLIISIHVPSWGTTIHQSQYMRRLQISIHVPSWGTTESPKQSAGTLDDFNPRSLVGNDCKFIDFIRHGGISIHVPSWGTTNPFKYISNGFQFQSTFPRGERRQIFTNILCFFMQ